MKCIKFHIEDTYSVVLSYAHGYFGCFQRIIKGSSITLRVLGRTWSTFSNLGMVPTGTERYTEALKHKGTQRPI
jgi:hypothetical protein